MPVTNMSRRVREEYSRFYTVTDHRTHEKGYTEYKVTAKIVSKKNPDESKQIVVWKRYSDFKKLHGDLSYVHRNLFRGTEEFPPFPKAQVFGRFDAAVIEERRSSAENLLKFTVNIPALSNSPQLKEFFKGVDAQKSSETSDLSDLQTLPPPLVPVLVNASKKDEQHENLDPHEYSVHLPTLEGCEELYEEETETAVSALDDFLDEFVSAKSCNKEEEETECTGGIDKINSDSCVSENEPIVAYHDAKAGECVSSVTQEDEELNHSLNSGVQSKEMYTCLLSEHELALFDPCAKQEQNLSSISHGDELSELGVEPLRSSSGEHHFTDLNFTSSCLLNLHISDSETDRVGEDMSTTEPESYLSLAKEQIQLAMTKEAAKDYSSAFLCYRNGVDILLRGAQGDSDTARREAVKRKTAEYLQHAEEIFNLHLKDAQPCEVPDERDF